MQIALIANPESGAGDAEEVAARLAAAGADVETFPVADARRAEGSGAERIVVAGGDGSIGPAAEVAASIGVPLAVIAAGTANDFASHLGLPDDLEEGCRLAATGARTRRIDLARICGRPFVNVAGAGLPPAAAEEASDLKERLGALAYPVGAIGAGMTTEPIRVEVAVDGDELFAGAAWQASVASGGAFGGGAGFEADPADGELDVVVIEGGSRTRLVKHALGLRFGGVEEQAGVVSARGRQVEIRLDPGESLNVDGEIVAANELDADGVLTFTAEPGALDVVVG